LYFFDSQVHTCSKIEGNFQSTLQHRGRVIIEQAGSLMFGDGRKEDFNYTQLRRSLRRAPAKSLRDLTRVGIYDAKKSYGTRSARKARGKTPEMHIETRLSRLIRLDID